MVATVIVVVVVVCHVATGAIAVVVVEQPITPAIRDIPMPTTPVKLPMPTRHATRAISIGPATGAATATTATGLPLPLPHGHRPVDDVQHRQCVELIRHDHLD